jgi:RNA polymerase sigma-70 factor (ECF subfamily)
LRRRDEKGLELLFDTHYRPLVMWADSFLQDVTRAEDLVQEFFVRLWERRFVDGLSPAALRAYLFASVRNAAINALGRKDPLRMARGVTRADGAWAEYDDLTERMLQELEREVERLPSRSREVVRAVYVDGLRYKEVAERYAISVATVKTLLVGALKHLREKTRGARDRFFLLFFRFSRGEK